LITFVEGRQRLVVQAEPFLPLLGAVELLGVLRVDVLQRPLTDGVLSEGVPPLPDGLDVHQQQGPACLGALVAKVPQARLGQAQAVADELVEVSLEF
jgi:hypothetical protein